MGSYAEILIAFAMVALLGLILRFTFGRELTGGSDGAKSARRDQGSGDAFIVVSEDPVAPQPATAPGGDDFGLLAAVAVTVSPDEAASLRARLGEAGIRATTARGADGRHRVLVFAAELGRARMITGGAP